MPAADRAIRAAYDTGARVFDLAPGVLERVADTVTPQPVLAVVGFAPELLEDLPVMGRVLVLADVRDPGNAGTMLRTADAAGVDAVVTTDGTVDPTNPKCVRASAGSLFHLPVVRGGRAPDALGTLRDRGLRLVGTVVHGGTDYDAFDWLRPHALVFGNEAGGLEPALVDRLDDLVTVPMAGRAESLNVSVSAAVLCFEALRQHRRGVGGAPPTMPGMEGAPSDRDGRDPREPA